MKSADDGRSAKVPNGLFNNQSLELTFGGIRPTVAALTTVTHHFGDFMHRATKLACVIAVALMATLPLGARAQNIDTRNVDSYVHGGFGIYGQSFTVGGLTTLNSFSLWVGASSVSDFGTGPYDFYTQLFRFDGANIVGSSLYTSSTMNAVCCDNLVPPRFDFSVGGLALTSGAQYLALVARTTTGELKMGYVKSSVGFTDAYVGGQAYAGNRGDGAPNPSAASYIAIDLYPGNDLMFVAKFAGATTTAPEPSTFALLAVGAGALLIVRRRRRR